MRVFYEDKVREMELALNDKETERDDLLKQLKASKTNEASTKELQINLRDKERHIADLRKKHKQLTDLTAVSSRNQVKISRLQDDVKDMKRKKVDLQKLVSKERKEHAQQLRVLEQEARQKDKELSRWKKVSSAKEVEAERANQMAKTRMAELTKLRTKYKDAEKRLRMVSLKRGVLEKAGLDPVLVGRRASAQASIKKATTDHVDSLREFFDKQVNSIVKKEALADKLAHEWEEHFDLTSRREQDEDNDGSNLTNDEKQALDLQIAFKEGRIRKLAAKLGSQQQDASGKENEPIDDTFINDEAIAKLVQGTRRCGLGSPRIFSFLTFGHRVVLNLSENDVESSKTLATKVLFGMVVREKRRTAALARTASSLDERLQAAEKDASVSESAFRTYMEEQDEEVAVISQNQQEHILSLMNMVKDETTRDCNEKGKNTDSMLLVLANERIAVLEQHLSDLQSRDSSRDTLHKVKYDELKRSLDQKVEDYEALLDEIDELHIALREIKEEAEKVGGKSTSVAELANLALRPNMVAEPVSARPALDGLAQARRTNEPSQPRTPTSLVYSSDEDDDCHEEPDWSNDIMADLAMIAEGKVPPSMEPSFTFSDHSKSSVFDRLADPQSFTGTQKHQPVEKREAASSTKGQQDRRAMSKTINDRLNQIVVPNEGSTSHGDSDFELEPRNSRDSDSTHETSNRIKHESSPSKEKTKKKALKRIKVQPSCDAADRLLDDLLKNDDEDPLHSSASNLYTRQNVFERLQKTTTQSYAVKHGGSGPEESGPKRDPYPHPLSPVSFRDSVFDRLTKTTTEAYANKNRAKHP